MYIQIEKLVCNQCEKVIEGIDGTAQQHRDYIRIQNRITKSVWLEDLKHYLHVFLTNKDDKHLDFCSRECLVEFIESQYEMKKSKAENYLRDTLRPDNDPIYAKPRLRY